MTRFRLILIISTTALLILGTILLDRCTPSEGADACETLSCQYESERDELQAALDRVTSMTGGYEIQVEELE